MVGAGVQSAMSRAMPIKSVLMALADPRGRCNRRGFLMLAVALLVVQLAAVSILVAIGHSLHGAAGVVLNGLILWTVTAAISKRLHDLGLSAWWVAKAGAAVLLWGVLSTSGLMLVLEPASFEPGGLGYGLVLAALVIPVLLSILWLHVAAGDAGPNRHGPEPAGFGISDRGSVPAVAVPGT